MKKLYLAVTVIAACLASGFVCMLYRYEKERMYHSEIFEKLKSHVIASREERDLKNGILASSGTGDVTKRWSDIQPKVKDTVVQVWVQKIDFNWLEPYKTPQQGLSTGSGFFIDEKGSFITNFHVVNGSVAVEVQIPSMGKQRLLSKVIALNPDRDLALVRLTQESLERVKDTLGFIPYLRFGNSDTVRRSDEIMTLGYPLGQQSLKSTTGVVSGREHIDGHYMIQISAPINPGNSGGPSVDQDAQVVGVNTAGFAAAHAQNVNYIIPSNEVTQFLKHAEQVHCEDNKDITFLRKPFLGVHFNPASESLTTFLKNPLPGGLYVVETYKNSPLQKAGVIAGDMIYDIDGHRLDIYGEMNVPWCEDKVSIVDYVSRLMLGDKIHITVYRNGKPLRLSFVFDQCELPAVRQRFPPYEKIDYELFGGMVFMDLALDHISHLIQSAPHLSKYMDFKNQLEPAVVLAHVLPDSVALRSHVLMRGQIIKEINGVEVKNLVDVRNALRKSIGSDHVTLKTAEKMFVALPFKKMLEDEDKLSRMLFYTITPFTQELMKADRAAHT
ncbi:MAG: trypsin-like peptidase domain-containing protein [Candidatus Babeliaceae bacterium]|nr:trypsin-like peptidase domain-containing protein [Candidatus Babeliaceae bacterium]